MRSRIFYAIIFMVVVTEYFSCPGGSEFYYRA